MRADQATKEGQAFDLIGIGFGPSNLALAVCAREVDTRCRCLFLERNAQFDWHPGMLLDGARMQISFLKDLVSLRNLASPYTFLRYTKARGRLEQFVNLNQFRPTRLEYQDYLRWVAAEFADQVRYDAAVQRVTPISSNGSGLSLFRVEVEDVATRVPSVYFARNIVYAAGGKARKPANGQAQARGVIHSSEFLPRFPALFADRAKPYVFAVAGGGQSAGEIVAYLMQHYDQAQVHLLISKYALRPTDNSPFVNEQFYWQRADDFYHFADEKRAALLQELRDTNYGTMRQELLEDIYNTAYLDAVKARQRLFIHDCSRLSGIREKGQSLRATIEDRFGGPERELRCDGIVLATGYERSLDADMFAAVFPLLARDSSGRLQMSRNCRVQTAPELRAGFYVQGYGELVFGLGDTLLSLLPFRSKEIFEDICAHTRNDVSDAEPSYMPLSQIRRGTNYPPELFLERNPQRLYAVIERFRFATVISARGPDDPLVTQVPLTLDRSRGAKGILFGHMDRANPHVDLLDGRKVLVLFHGPNAYISPKLSKENVLPTWNSITVRVHGRVTLLEGRAPVVRGLCGLAAQAEDGGRLLPEDPRIERLIDFIVGFEIEIEEIVGRFKLSQDRSEADQRSAAVEMARKTEAGQREIIAYAVGLAGIEEDLDAVLGVP